MKHYTAEQWLRYVNEELPYEEQLEYETHLGSCDQCLEQYMKCLASATETFPMLADDKADAMAEAVMQQIESATPSVHEVQKKSNDRRKRPTPSFLGHPVFHYTVAAAVTFLLMGTGLFQSFADRLGSADTSMEAAPLVREDSRVPVSQLIMEKTIIMLDSIQPKQERGGTR